MEITDGKTVVGSPVIRDPQHLGITKVGFKLRFDCRGCKEDLEISDGLFDRIPNHDLIFVNCPKCSKAYFIGQCRIPMVAEAL
jgi:hypothetical protein